MILISELKNLCEEILTNDTAINGGFVTVIDAENAKNKLAAKPGVILVAAVPTAEGSGQLGQRRNRSALVFFVLKKPKSDQNDVDLLEELQPVILNLQAFIEEKAESGCDFLQELEPNQMIIDPINNEFGGLHGWSITAVF